jgi:branched-chain amino acid aminotransferase
MNTSPEWMLVDGELTAFADAKLHVLSTSLKYGIGVFEGLRAYWDDSEQQLYGFRVAEHFNRLSESLKIAAIDQPADLDAYAEQLSRLIRACGYRENLHMRVQVFVNSIDGSPHASGPTMTTMAAIPMGGYFSDTSLEACVSSWARNSDRAAPPRAKALGNYHNSRLAMSEARANGYSGTIMLSQAGLVSEGPGYNVFVVRDGCISTPRTTDAILEGVTRDTLIQLAGTELGNPVVERAIDRSELYVADEIFVCGSAAEVTPLVSVDRKPVAGGTPGPITQALKKLYLEATHGRLAARRDWVTPVYPANEDGRPATAATGGDVADGAGDLPDVLDAPGPQRPAAAAADAR